MLGPTLLARYLARLKLSDATFAEAVKADRARVHRWRTGKRSPSLDAALRIEDATKGAVPAASWTDDEEDCKPRRAVVRRPRRSSLHHSQ